MKVGVIILILLLCTLSVSAELSVSCVKDSDCHLALADQSYSCVASSCVKYLEKNTYVSLEPAQKSLDWDIAVIEEKKDVCSSCKFAPEKEKNIWKKILDFILYL